MAIPLKNFQIKAIDDLMTAMQNDCREIVLKSCTGSGKTIILTHFMDNYMRSFGNTVFIWLTPGKGNLEEQSKEKMDRYIYGASTKLLCDVMTSGFSSGDACFINWEKLTKKGNTALKDSERTNFLEHIEKALDLGISFKVIVDESHQNDTVKADEIIEYFKTDKIIRCSATPKPYKNVTLIEVPEEDVISEGLIKKLLIINEDFAQNITVTDQITYLIDKALEKQRSLRSAFLNIKTNINPLIVVQLPNKSEALLESVENYFTSKGISYENNQLAVWLADKKQNLEDIEEPNATPIAVIIKQAVATGWDCPRAHILVKLRDNMSETFEIQTIGRIRRMPEAKHYYSDLLDCCYLYTLDGDFTQQVKQSLGKGALDARKLFLKPEFRKFNIITEYKTDVPFPRDAALMLRVFSNHFKVKYNLDGKLIENKTKLEVAGYNFKQDIVDYTKSGAVAKLEKEQIDELNVISIHEELNTTKHGRAYHHCTSEIGLKATLDYSRTNTVLRKLFLKDVRSDYKVLGLEIRELYSFVINNKTRLIDEMKEAVSSTHLQGTMNIGSITEKPIGLPLECMFTYDGTAKTQYELQKNVYKGYLVSAEKRSASEKLFEKYCEKCDSVQWIYKNGDKGAEFFSIVYEDNLGKQKSFYPDYIVSVDGQIWIIETKGGFTKTGESEDIDRFTGKKFEVLKKYLDKYKLKGGIVRQDKQSFELCICTESYSDDIKSDSWQLLSDVFKE